MLFVEGLRCRECGRAYPAEALHVCEYCFGPLEVVYDYEAVAAATSRASIAAGPTSIWRYAGLLPAHNDGAVDLGAGFTPLVRADRLAAELGLRELWLKNDTLPPHHRPEHWHLVAGRRLGGWLSRRRRARSLNRSG